MLSIQIHQFSVQRSVAMFHIRFRASFMELILQREAHAQKRIIAAHRRVQFELLLYRIIMI